MGKRISREALDDSDHDASESDEEEEEEGQFADPDDSDVDVNDDDQEIDSENALGDSDIEKFKDFSFRASKYPAKAKLSRISRPRAADFMSDSDGEEDSVDGDASGSEETDEDELDIDAQHGEQEDGHSEQDGSEEDGDESGEELSDEEDDKSSESSQDGDDEQARRAELRKIMNEEQKTVVASISQAAKADADKGNAVKQQRKVFDSLLSVRMVLQKGLIATNTFSTVEADETGDEAYQAAEDAALKLWNTLDGLRHQLVKATSDAKLGQKRKRDVDSSTPSSQIWERMQASEVASIDLRQQTLDKWWKKTKASTAPLTGKLNNNVTTMTLTSVIQEHLAKPDAISKTQKARSCAPVQEKAKILEDSTIYDDTTLYKMLLNQLVEQRKSDAGATAGGIGAPAQWVVKEAKMRKVVDTKASKGRKMRYTVHEKLQNFMAPENRGDWGQERKDQFFGSLLGQKMGLGEDDMAVDYNDKGLDEGEGMRLL